MSSQSPQRTRKSQPHQSTIQTNVRREASPSPTLRERQRYGRTQSMPIVSSVNEGERESPKDGGLPSFGYPRPIALARVAPPQFLAHAHSEKWQMTDDLAEDAPPAPGTAGVAYAGGAGSTAYGHLKSLSTGSTSSTVESQADSSSTSNRRRTSGELAQHRASPLSYVIRKTANTSPGYPSMPSPRALKNRTPDRSLPVQEEPDDHEQTRVSPAPSSDLNPTKDLEHDAEGTLVDLGDDDDHQQPNEESTEGEGSGTPRSPANVLFDQGQSRSIHEVLQPDKQGSKHFSPSDFQSTIKKLQSEGSVTSSHPPPPIPPFSRQEYSRNESRGSYPNWMFDYYHNYPEEIDFYDEAAYMPQFVPQPISTQAIHIRPDAPIPPTPHSQTSAPTPFRQPQHGSHTSQSNGTAPNEESSQRTLLPSFSPAPPSGTPYPYPFSHVRRGFPYPPPVPRVPSSVYDPGVVQEQLRLQMQMYAYNNGAMSDSTLSPASTPYPGVGPTYAPFSAFLNQSRAYARARDGAGEDGRITSASIRSSPSHLPVSLPPMLSNGRGRALKKRNRFSNLSGKVNGALRSRKQVDPPPRVESTQPRETSPESSSGEETAGEKYEHAPNNESRINGNISQEWTSDTAHVDDDDGEWVDEDSEDEKDMLDFEFHPSFVSNPERRRRRWDQRWDDLVRAFQALDRETDATLVLLASPSHANTLHSLTSRSIRRDPSLIESHSMSNVKTAFEQIASQRRSARSQRASVIDRLVAASSPSLDGSTTSASEREEDLRKLLKTVLSGFEQLKDMYDARELRWLEEERRMREEREGVNLLLKQTFGETAHTL